MSIQEKNSSYRSTNPDVVLLVFSPVWLLGPDQAVSVCLHVFFPLADELSPHWLVGLCECEYPIVMVGGYILVIVGG